MIRLTYTFHEDTHSMPLTNTGEVIDLLSIMDTQEHVFKITGGDTQRHEHPNVIALDVVCFEHLTSDRWCGTLIIEKTRS